MLLKDPLYGKFAVTEGVLLDLLKSPSVCRLKGVSQRGYPKFVYEEQDSYQTRYEHSLGCMLLLRKLGASIEEQAAGLLHDVSHTAFSHVIDWAIGNNVNESYQDRILKDYIMKSEIPSILYAHGFDSAKISEMEEMDHFGLLERRAPQLCVDRLDYSLRDLYYTFNNDPTYLVDQLAVHDGHVVFKSLAAAGQFARLYAKCQKEIWGAPQNVARYYLIGKLLKDAMAANVISMSDIHKDETELIDRISGDPMFAQQSSKAFGKLRFQLVEQGGVKLQKKFRFVDPEFMDGSVVRTLTQIDQEYKENLEHEAAVEKKGFNVKFID